MNGPRIMSNITSRTSVRYGEKPRPNHQKASNDKCSHSDEKTTSMVRVKSKEWLSESPANVDVLWMGWSEMKSVLLFEDAV